MKKLALLLSVAILASCTYRNNNINFLPARNKLFTYWQTEKIFYYDKALNGEFLSESQVVNENKLEKGQVLITHAGEEMAVVKTYRTDYYSTESVKPNKNGELESAYSPIYIKKKAKYEAIGEVTYDGETYMLVHEDKSKDIILVNGDGEIYNHIGRILDGRLIVLNAEFYPYPKDLRMVPVVETRVENSENAEGYSLVYEGLDNGGDEIVFTYHELGKDPEEIRFSICDELIDIHGLQIDIFDAREDRIEYMIK